MGRKSDVLSEIKIADVEDYLKGKKNVIKICDELSVGKTTIREWIMKIEYLIKKTLQGLLATAREKICVMGEEGAKDDLKKLREVYEDLVLFWGLDEELIGKFDEKVGYETV